MISVISSFALEGPRPHGLLRCLGLRFGRLRLLLEARCLDGLGESQLLATAKHTATAQALRKRVLCSYVQASKFIVSREFKRFSEPKKPVLSLRNRLHL